MEEKDESCEKSERENEKKQSEEQEEENFRQLELHEEKIDVIERV